jgi:lipopolysaccharide export system permease protein
MVYALFLAFGLRWLGFSVTNMSERNAAFVPLVYAVPLITSGITIFMLATNRQLQMPRFIGRGLSALTRSMRRRVPSASRPGGTA